MIAVIGAGQATKEGLAAAERVGRYIAERGAVLVCGGLGGVMEAASRGCAAAGGVVVGILPGDSTATANPHVTVPIATNMGHARNAIIAHTADVLIAIEGEFGTLSETAISLKLKKTVIQLNSRPRIEPALQAATPEQAADMAFVALEEDTHD
jgi:uncharacterized protein (TIGR00725 family)